MCQGPSTLLVFWCGNVAHGRRPQCHNKNLRGLTTLLLIVTPVLGAQRPAPHEVLAFYYGWYGNPDISGRFIHWSSVDTARHNIGSAAHFPVLGPYDSHDPNVIAKHVQEAKDAGITGFIMSWWGRLDFHDIGMRPMLDAATKAGLKITIYYETCKPRGAPSIDGTSEELIDLLKRYGKDPAWLKVNGKPVVFVYGRAVNELKLDGWRQIIDQVNHTYRGGALFIGDQLSPQAAELFDGIHTYNPTGKTAGKSANDIRTWAHDAYPQWVHMAGSKIACVTVIPGYDDTKTGRKRPRPITDRHGGETYRVLWQEAIAAHPDWVLLTTWNEWHEGSEIEPSMEIGDRELKTTAEFAPNFR